MVNTDISISAPFPPSPQLHVSESLSSSLFFPFYYVALSHSCFPPNRHIQSLSGKQKWGRNLMPFFTFGWLPVVLGLIQFPLCPTLRLMCPIRLTQHTETYRWWICSQINLELNWQVHGSQQTIRAYSWSTAPLSGEERSKPYHTTGQFSLSNRFRLGGMR